MISYFPPIYPDELLYSQLARYYVKSGHIAYCYAAKDLYLNPSIRPNEDSLNTFTEDALKRITQYEPLESIVERHTMFPLYGRFLPKERRNILFKSFVSMSNHCKNYLPIKNKGSRYLRYCPICVVKDREQYGETYWHRIHQLQGLNVCPTHHSKLINSNYIIDGNNSPTLIAAENVIPQIEYVIMCESKIECKLAEYIMMVSQSRIDLENDVLAGDFLHSRMAGTQYRSTRGKQRNISLLHKDFIKYYENLSDNWLTELWQIQKVFTNYSNNIVEICMLAMFLKISVQDLLHMELPKKSQEEIFDENIYKLRAQGMSYPKISQQLNSSINTIKSIGENRYGTYHQKSKNQRKCGIKPKDWKKIDTETLPQVRQAIKELQGNGITRPKRITISSIGKILNLNSKQIENMDMCKKEIQKHYMSQREYWAMEVVWAAKFLIREGKPFNWKHIRDLTNIRKQNLFDCSPYLTKFADIDLCEKISLL